MKARTRKRHERQTEQDKQFTVKKRLISIRTCIVTAINHEESICVPRQCSSVKAHQSMPPWRPPGHTTLFRRPQQTTLATASTDLQSTPATASLTVCLRTPRAPAPIGLQTATFRPIPCRGRIVRVVRCSGALESRSALIFNFVKSGETQVMRLLSCSV